MQFGAIVEQVVEEPVFEAKPFVDYQKVAGFVAFVVVVSISVEQGNEFSVAVPLPPSVSVPFLSSSESLPAPAVASVFAVLPASSTFQSALQSCADASRAELGVPFPHELLGCVWNL